MGQRVLNISEISTSEPILVIIPSLNEPIHDRLMSWLEHKTIGNYLILQYYVVFAEEQDAVLFKLGFK